MNLTELSAPAPGALPVRALADHLRLGSGFADDGSQDSLLDAYLQAAMAAIEARTGRVILEREFEWEAGRWASADCQPLPVGPVRSVNAVALVSQDGIETTLEAASYTLRIDAQRPAVVTKGMFPRTSSLGSVRIRFTAGYGADWDHVPSDLAQAVILLAGYFYENRNEMQGKGGILPFGVQSLIERYRQVRVSGGAL